MIDEIAAAFEQNNFKRASQLLAPLLQRSPHDPWARLDQAKLQEVNDQPGDAEAGYRDLLQKVISPRIALQARQGLMRLDAAAAARRQDAIAQAEAELGNTTGTGFLILEPIRGDARKPMAQCLARIMKLDPYTAELQLPSRGWRLYRKGAIAEIQTYANELRDAGIPAFSAALSDICKLRVFRVQFLQTLTPEPTLVCKNETGQLGSIRFDWAEVSYQVRAMLPIFEDVVDLNAQNKLTRKEKTQDYAQVCDLHLPKRHCILRICDQSYQFREGIQFEPQRNGQIGSNHSTTRIRWNALLNALSQHLKQAPALTGFNSFAENALEHFDLIENFETHIDLFRKSRSHWDEAFHVYSSLIFLNPPH